MEPALMLMSVKMGPISADITRYVRIQEAAIVVCVQEGTGLKDLEDPVWILMNVKILTPASMSVKIPLGAIGVSVHLAISSCSMERHVKILMSAWNRMCAVGQIACVST